MKQSHWTDRIVKFMTKKEKSYCSHVTVIKDSAEPPQRIKYTIKVGQLWYQENFPLSYVQFLTFLMKPSNLTIWHKQGYIYGSKWNDWQGPTKWGVKKK